MKTLFIMMLLSVAMISKASFFEDSTLIPVDVDGDLRFVNVVQEGANFFIAVYDNTATEISKTQLYVSDAFDFTSDMSIINVSNVNYNLFAVNDIGVEFHVFDSSATRDNQKYITFVFSGDGTFITLLKHSYPLVGEVYASTLVYRFGVYGGYTAMIDLPEITPEPVVCECDCECDAIVTTKSDELFIDDGIVFPTVANDYINVQGSPDASVDVFNANGELVIRVANNAPVDVSTLHAGVYYVTCGNLNGSFVKE